MLFKKNIWLIGDSIFDHEKFNDVNNFTVLNLLKIEASNYNIINASEAGLTTNNLIKSINCNKYKSIKSNDYVFLSIGGNDIINYIFEKNIIFEDIFNNIKIIINYLQQFTNNIYFIIPYKYFV